jgi:hypothetical protein
MGRSVTDLEANAEKFWPKHLAEREKNASIIPALIESQEKFIGVLYVADASPDAWIKVLKSTADMPCNLFLKHLMVLSDTGGEKIQRFRANINDFFTDGKMEYVWRDKQYVYKFKSLLEARTWTNTLLGVDGKGLSVSQRFQNAHEDVAMFLMYAGASNSSAVPDDVIEKCVLGTLLGRKKELDTFVRQRYIHVSRITGGATSNAMGQLCQSYVREYLQASLKNWDYSKTSIPGISQNKGRTNMAFDVVAESPSGKYCAIEVSFQVTTNSVIERKAGQAQARQKLLHKHGHRIAYVVDGAGNFQRDSALSTICQFSDCAVTFKRKELDKLVEYLRSIDK